VLGLKTWLLALLLLLTMSVSAVLAVLPAEEGRPVVTTLDTSPGTHLLTVRSEHYGVLFAVTPEQRAQGLGGRRSLPTGQGMLFLYGRQQNLCFWMKDMHIAIDMLWLNQEKRITHIEPSVSPATYPGSFCNRGAFVLELSAGQAAAQHLKIGDQASF